MTERVPFTIPSGWYNEEGPAYDVIVSSRIRISRNLSEFKYMAQLEPDEENEVADRVKRSFEQLSGADSLAIRRMGDLKPLKRRVLMERNFLSQDFTLQTRKYAVVSHSERLSAMINETDHLRLSCIRGGLNLDEAWESVDKIDSALEENLNFASSLQFGYLNPEIENIGTGLRGSVMLQLPALESTGLIEKAIKHTVNSGLGVKGYFGDEEHSLGSLYQIFNETGFGVSESEIISFLDKEAVWLVDLERQARKELSRNENIELEDQAFRALGVLKYCRSLSAREAVDRLTSLRLGVVLGFFHIPLDVITGLLFLTQKSHIQEYVEAQDLEPDDVLIDYNRARIIQQCLKACESGRTGV